MFKTARARSTKPAGHKSRTLTGSKITVVWAGWLGTQAARGHPAGPFRKITCLLSSAANEQQTYSVLIPRKVVSNTRGRDENLRGGFWHSSSLRPRFLKEKKRMPVPMQRTARHGTAAPHPTPPRPFLLFSAEGSRPPAGRPRKIIKMSSKS